MERLIEAINNNNKVKDVLKAFLIALTHGNERKSSLAQTAVTSGVIQCLTSLLNKSLKYSRAEGSASTNTEQNSALENHDFISENTTVTVLALSCIYHICDNVTPFLYKNFVDKDFISTLLRCIIPDPALDAEPDSSNYLFQFGSAYKATVKDALSSFGNDGCVWLSIQGNDQCQTAPTHQKTTGAEVSDISETKEKKELRFYEPVCYQALDKLAQIKPCQMHFSTEAEEKTLAGHLISSGVAWPEGDKTLTSPGSSKLSKPKLTQNISKLEAAKITHVLSGNFVWAVIGEEKINQIQILRVGLLHFKSHLVNVKPKKLDVISAKIKEDSKETIVRGRIIEDGDEAMTVMDLDSGCLHQVQPCDIYNLPSLYNLIKLPPLASLLCLQGVSPPPLDTRVPELALGSLGLILRNDSIETVQILLKSTILDTLPGLVACPDLEVSYRALEMVVNLISYRIQKVRFTSWYTLIPGVIATLERCMKRTVENRQFEGARKLGKSKKRSSLSSNSSDMPFSPSASESSSSGDSMATSPALGFIKNSRIKAIVEACLACLANSVFLCVKGKSFFYQNHGLDIVLEAFSLYYDQSNIRTMCLKTLANYVYFNKSSNPVLSRYRSRGVKSRQQKVTEKSSKEKKERENLFPDLEGHSATDSEDEEDSSSLDVSSQSSGVDMHKSSSFTSEDSEDCSTAPSRYYVGGDKVQFIQDATHELLLTSRPCKNDFAAIVCGFLNTGRTGTIYLGIDPKDSVVLGVELDHDARDDLRMGVDHLLAESLKPGLLHLQFHVEFVPVVSVPSRTESKDKGASATDRSPAPAFHLGHDYVVEVEVKPLPNILYCCNTNECFYRLDGKTVVLDCQLIRQLLILEEEAEHVEQIVQLRQELDTLREEAAEMQIFPSDL